MTDPNERWSISLSSLKWLFNWFVAERTFSSSKRCRVMTNGVVNESQYAKIQQSDSLLCADRIDIWMLTHRDLRSCRTFDEDWTQIAWKWTRNFMHTLILVGNVKYFTFDNTKTEVTSLALSFYSGLFAYNGW